MNKLLLVILGATFMLLSTGCGAFHTIPKDHVMVKEIPKDRTSNEVTYEGALSQEAVKTLSLNAVSKYFNMKLTIDEVQFELTVVDQRKLKDLLDKIEYGVLARPMLDQGLKVDSKSELNKLPNGLFYVTLTLSADSNKIYDIVMNARDGGILKISTNKEHSSEVREPQVVAGNDEVIQIANRFIEDKSAYTLSDLSVDVNSSRLGSTTELYYRSKDNQALVYSVLVNIRTKQVVEFNKDVMAMLSYFSGS